MSTMSFSKQAHANSTLNFNAWIGLVGKLTSVFSPGFLQRARGGGGGGGEQDVRFICPCPCTVSLLCAVLLANGEQQMDNGRRRTVIHRNVPLIIRLPRRVIADHVLASC